MIVQIIKTGEIQSVEAAYGVRLIEQGARGMLVNAGDALTIWTE